MKNIYLFLLSFLSCGVGKDNNEYGVERINEDNFYTINMLDKNSNKILSMNFDYDGKLKSCSICEIGFDVPLENDTRNFMFVVNLKEDGIVSYTITDGYKYNNTTNLYVDDELILIRKEQIDENIYEENINRNGFIIKEKNGKY